MHFCASVTVFMYVFVYIYIFVDHVSFIILRCSVVILLARSQTKHCIFLLLKA